MQNYILCNSVKFTILQIVSRGTLDKSINSNIYIVYMELLLLIKNVAIEIVVIATMFVRGELE